MPVSNRLDYSNSLLSGIADTDLAELQRVQNRLARVVTKSSPFTHSFPLLRSLHWLPVKCRVDFKICLLTHKTLSEKQPVSRPMLGKGHLALVPLLFGTALEQSVHPLQFPPLGNVSRHIFLTWPFPRRHLHAR